MLKKISLLSFGLLVLSYHLIQESYISLLMDVEHSIDRSIENIENDIERVTWELNKLLYDDSKMKYRPIGVAVHEVNEKMNNAVDTIAEIEELIVKGSLSKRETEHIIHNLEKYLADLELDISTKHLDFIQEYGRTFGFREEEIEPYLNKKQEIIKFQCEHCLTRHYKKNDEKILSFILSKTVLEIRNVQWQLVESLTELAGGWPTFCNFGFFPVIHPTQNYVRKGETFSAIIELAPFEQDMYPSDVRVFVDKEQLAYVEGKYILYKSAPIFTNKKTIKISCQFKNRITNTWEVAFTDFPYEIRVN